MYLEISRLTMFITLFLERLYFFVFVFVYIEGIHIYTLTPIKGILHRFTFFLTKDDAVTSHSSSLNDIRVEGIVN